MDFYLNMLLK